VKNEGYGIRIPDEKKPMFLKKLCDRRFGIGADAILFVEEKREAA